MRIAIQQILFLLTYNYGLCQDGSDIRYYRSKDINEDVIGKTAQIDFYRWSYRGKISKVIDTVEIEVDQRKLRFIERRNDDGYNNWFREQYLEHIDPIDGSVIRIEQFVIVSISNDVIVAEGFIKFYDRSQKLQKEKLQKYEFQREIVAGLLSNRE